MADSKRCWHPSPSAPSLVLFAVFLGSVMVTARSVQAESCDSCYTRIAPRCQSICDKQPNKSEVCFDNCSEIKCRKACVFKEVAPPPAKKIPGAVGEDQQTAAACESCLKEMEFGVCETPCRNREDPATCQKRCAKVKCSRKCTLPGTTTDPAAPVDYRSPAQSCGDCKKTKQMTCAQRCGDRDRAGYTACEVSCVEEECLQICNPGLF